MVAFNKNSGKVPFEFGQETLATRVVDAPAIILRGTPTFPARSFCFPRYGGKSLSANSKKCGIACVPASRRQQS